MRIALVTGSAGDGKCGVGDYAYELAQHLALDANVELYFDKQHAPATPAHPKLTTLELHPVGGFSALMIKSLAGQLRNGEYDIVHIQYPSKGYGASLGPAFLPQNLAGMNSRSRIAVTLHEWHTSHPLRKMAMDQMLPSVDALIVSNQEELQGLVSKLNGRPVMVMPVGNILRSRPELDAVWLSAAGQPVPGLREPTGPANRMPNSLFHFGLPAKGKGFRRLLEALSLVRKAGVPAVLHLGGYFPAGDPLSEELLNTITELNLAEAVVRLGHIPLAELERTAEQYMLGVFPFDEGYCSKRSSIATISHCDLPLAVGGGSKEEHPYYAPSTNTAAALSVILLELLSGKLASEWTAQVARQREYAARFSFAGLAQSHLALYQRLLKKEG